MVTHIDTGAPHLISTHTVNNVRENYTYATAADVISRWIGSDDPGPVEVIQKYLDDAEVILRWEIKDLDDRVDADSGMVARVLLVECRMVIRALKNPDLKRQTALTTGPFTESSTYGTETLTGLGVTPEDIALLEGIVPAKQKAFSIDTAPKRVPSEGFEALCGARVNGPEWVTPGHRG